MVSIKIIDSARFVKMPVSSQALYFHLITRADDDGIVEAYNIMRMTGAMEDDLKLLVAKGFVTVLNEDLVSYINDWNEHNLIRADRKIDSIYKELLLKIVPDVDLIEKKPRADVKKQLNIITGQINDRTTSDNGQTNVSIGKVRLGKDKKDIVEIINYLNCVANKNFKTDSKTTNKHINARLDEGFIFEDFKAVINIKSKQWLNDNNMSKYLRPETLFGNKFEAYLNENKSSSKEIDPGYSEVFKAALEEKGVEL